MSIVFGQISLMFIFIMSGWILGKTKIVKSEHTAILSALCVYLFLPANSIKAFSESFSVENIKNYYPLLIISSVTIIILTAISLALSKVITKDRYERKVMFYTLIIPNFGYMGYALAEGIYGTSALLDIIIYAIPFSIFCYSVGYCTLTGKSFSFKKLLNPPLIAILIGIIVGLTNFEFPGVLASFMGKASSCMAPVSMLLAGITISEFASKKLVSDKKVYLVCLLRLLVIPIAVFLVMKPFFSKSALRSAVLLNAMPCGLNTIVFPKLIGEDCELGAKLAFVSNIMALVTIPLILSLI